MAIAAQAQKQGGLVGFIDAEAAFNLENAKAMGVDPAKLVLAQPDSGNEAFKIIWEMCESKLFDLIILDSLAALMADNEVVDNAEDLGENKQIGAHAKMISDGMRRVNKKLADANTAVIVISQIRMMPGAYGNPENYGPQALKFYTSVVINLRSSKSDKITKRVNGAEVAIGQKIRATIIKNKMAPPQRKAEFELYFDSGISGEMSLIDAAVELGVITKSGASFSDAKTGERIAYGKENFKDLLSQDEGLMKSLTERVYEALRPNEVASEGSEEKGFLDEGES